MVHTYEDIGTRTPANPNEAAPEAGMPHAARGALLLDAVQGLPSPYTPKPSAVGSRAPTPRHGPSTPHGLRYHPSTATPGREWAKGRPAARGQGEAQGSRQAPTGTGHRG